jgi:hypothetical protein
MRTLNVDCRNKLTYFPHVSPAFSPNIRRWASGPSVALAQLHRDHQCWADRNRWFDQPWRTRPCEHGHYGCWALPPEQVAPLPGDRREWHQSHPHGSCGHAGEGPMDDDLSLSLLGPFDQSHDSTTQAAVPVQGTLLTTFARLSLSWLYSDCPCPHGNKHVASPAGSTTESTTRPNW